MIWSYRAINNPVARRKWLTLVALLLLVGFAYTAYKIVAGYPAGKAMIVALVFALFVCLYAIITLGKPRNYYIEGGVIYYRPFRTDLKKIEGYEVDEQNLVVKLKGAGFLGVRTLYFENIDDLREVVRALDRIAGRR